MEWHFSDGDKRVGPVSNTELENARHAGAVTDATLVWREGMSDWQAYGEVFKSPTWTPPNPYAAPAASLQARTASGGPARLVDSPRRVGICSCFGWLTSAWGLFRKEPLIWILAVIIAGVICFPIMIFSLIPIIGLIGNLALNILMVLIASGLFLMAANSDEGQSVDLGDMFRGFSHRPGAILAALGIYFAASIGGIILLGIFMQLTGFMGDNQEPSSALVAVVVIAALAITLPLVFSMVFSPALLALHPELEVIDAMKMSAIACFKNVLPGILAYLVAVVLFVIAALPLFLGWLVLFPVTFLMMYQAYKDIFLEVRPA